MPTTTTPLGPIEGVDVGGCERYAGIRYAKPPVGDLRFRPPQPVDAWAGVYDATGFGPCGPQPPPMPGALIASGELRTDEDCLFLNVYTPRADDGRRPVMVWIHGGAYTIGSGDIYDGSRLARRGGVVGGALNYRPRGLGWVAPHPPRPSPGGSGHK